MKAVHALAVLLIATLLLTYLPSWNGETNISKNSEFPADLILRGNHTVYYVSPDSTSTDWDAAKNESNPCSIETAIENASAGDIVYLMGGTYNITTPLKTRHAGTENARVIFRNYSSRRPVLRADGIDAIIFVENPYWSFEGLEFVMENLPDHDHAIIKVGYDHDANHLHISNCTFRLLSTQGHDNLGCIILQSNRSNYALIENSVFTGAGTNSDENYSFGIQYLGGGNMGTKILHNEFYDSKYAVFVKHANADSLRSGAEIAYNYVRNCSIGFYGNPVGINYHDNLVLGEGFDFGDNGGGPQGNNFTVNHNTVVNGGIHLWSPSEGPIMDGIIANNIIYGISADAYNGDTLALNYWDYNIYVHHGGIGKHDLGNTTPIFIAANPENISDFELADGSPGKNGGSDGTDIGANVSMVGINRPSRYFREPPPPENLSAKTGDSYVNLTWSASPSMPVGFRIYRNGTLLDFVFYGDGLFYNDTSVAGGNYTYFITSLTICGESENSSEIKVVVGTVPEIGDMWVLFLIAIPFLAKRCNHRRRN